MQETVEFVGSHPTAGSVGRLDNDGIEAALGQLDRRSEPGEARADHDDVSIHASVVAPIDDRFAVVRGASRSPHTRSDASAYPGGKES